VIRISGKDAIRILGTRSWETLLLLSHDIEPAARARGKRRLEREPLRKINLHWHDLRHEALSRLADEGVPVHELKMLAGHANITTTRAT
jgi:integrase